MSKPAAKPAAEGEVVAPKSKKKLFIIIGVAVALLGTGGAAAWHFMAPHDASKKEAEHKPALPPVFLNIERFTVNLQPDGSEQYLQAEIVVQVNPHRLSLVAPDCRDNGRVLAEDVIEHAPEALRRAIENDRAR